MPVVLFTISVFVAAFLVFAVQPLAGRLVLPLLGGSPAVWNTCLVFFQTTLLAGYAYAHFSTRLLGVRRQAVLHAVLVLVPLALLPIALPSALDPPAGDAAAVWWLLGVLAFTVGAPALVISSAGPLLQRWFAASCRRRDGSPRDPYPLYAASNAGSLLALLAYPVLIEPTLTLGAQRRWWSIGYAVFALLTIIAAVVVLREGRDAARMRLTPETDAATGSSTTAPPDGVRTSSALPGSPLRWMALAFVPSALLMGSTRFITTDIAPVPLLWVLPLAVYLLTFIAAFAGVGIASRLTRGATLAGPVLFTAVALAMLLQAAEPVLVVAGLHLVVLALGAMLCHGRLSLSRPPAEELTGFYLWIALGGALGGAFVAILAPIVFPALLEYPLAIGAAAVCMLPRGESSNAEDTVDAQPSPVRSLAVDVAIAVGMAALLFGLDAVAGGLAGAPAQSALRAGVPALLLFLLSRRARRFGLALAAVLCVAALAPKLHDNRVLERERSALAVHTVESHTARARDPATGELYEFHFHWLVHGTTLHGAQSTDLGLRKVPLTYYHPTGPVGDLFTGVLGTENARPKRIAAVGLGAGAVAAYLRPGDEMTFFELDPTVVRLAEDERLFTYLRDARSGGATVRTVLGDARLSLARRTGAGHTPAFDFILLDAFSSDAVPVHLLTTEAFELYLSRLAPGGVIAVHTSNVHLRLEPAVAAVAKAVGARAWVRYDDATDVDLDLTGKEPSTWMLIARGADTARSVVADRRGWAEITPPDGAGPPAWTDDFSNIWSVFRPFGG